MRDSGQYRTWGDRRYLHCLGLNHDASQGTSCRERVSPEDAQLQAQMTRLHILRCRAFSIQQLLDLF